jgi:hypothetical protein
MISNQKVSSEKLLSMRIPLLKIFLVLLFVNIYISGFSQDKIKKAASIESVLDSLKRSGYVFGNTQTKPDIVLSTNDAIKYLQNRLHPQFWNNVSDPLRLAFDQLIFEAAHPTLDSLRDALRKFPYETLSIPWDKFYIWEPLKIKIPVISKPVEADSLVGINREMNDSLNAIIVPVTVSPPLPVLKDTTVLVVIDTLNRVTSTNAGFPFKYVHSPLQGDSIQAAVNALLTYIDKRDSLEFRFTGIGKTLTPFMINSRSERVVRYWLKNEFADSVAVWIGNPSRNTIGLYLEQGISFKRPAKQGNYGKPKINLREIDNKTLLDLQNMVIKPKLWKYRTEASFVLNQTSMSNWVRGGEGSIATALDITGYAAYDNKERKVSSASFARLKFGYIKAGSAKLQKNLDLLETNSKINHLAFGKVDFSAIMLFKTQLANGKKYFSDGSSIVVSKFFNPATITVGLGFDYKPNKKTSINFSPLSYKGTFVLDTANIDQTLYGIAENRKSLNEPGASFMISHEFNPYKTVTVLNRLQLFTNYIHNPQNVDVDWEMIFTAHLNWFTDVRINTHIIFDDDTKTGKNVEGIEKKSARIQFKEMVGFAVSFRF